MKLLNRNYVFPIVLLSLIFCFEAFAQQIPELKVNATHADAVNAVAYSADGQYALSGSSDKTLKLWSPSSGREIRTLTGHTQSVTSVCFVPGGKQVMSGSFDGTLRLWDMATGKEIRNLGYGGPVMSVHVSPDGKWMAAGGYGGRIIVWEVATGKELKRLSGDSGVVNKIVFLPDNKHLVSGSTNAEIILWDISTGKNVKTYKGHTDHVTAIDVSPDGKTMLSGSMDKSIILWDVFSGKNLKVYTKYANSITTLRFSPDGLTFLSAARYEALRLWDVKSGNEIAYEPNIGFYVCDAAFSPDGRSIITGDVYRNVEMRMVPSLKRVKIFGGQQAKLQAVKFNSNDLFFAVDSILYRMSLMGNRKLYTYSLHKATILDISISPDGKYLLTASKDKTVKLWDIEKEKVVNTFAGHEAAVTLVRFSPDGKLCASTGFDKKIRLWDVATGKEIRSFFKPENITPESPMNTKGNIHDMNFSPDGKFLVSASMESSKKYLTVWEVATGKNPSVFKGHEFMARAACFTSDSKKVISGGSDKKLILWDLASSKEEITFSGHTGYISAVALSPDGKNIISSAEDNTMILWEISSGKLLKVFNGHTGPVESAQFSANGNLIVSESKDNTIKVWNTLTGKEVCTFFIMGAIDWVVVTPDGRFDGTEQGVREIYFVKNLEVMPLDALFEKYYTPGLLALAVKGLISETEAENMSKLMFPPDVRILTPTHESTATSDNITVDVEVTDKGSGIDEIRLYHNGKLVESSHRGFKEVTPKGNTFKQSYSLNLLFGPNELMAVAYGKDRTEGSSETVTVIYDKTTPQPHLYLLAVGIDKYKNSKYNLNYAVADAKAFAQQLNYNNNNLFAGVSVVMINDSAAVRDTIAGAFANMIEKVQPNDVFIFYYAGHGVMADALRGEAPEYFLIPYDVTQMYTEGNNLRNKAIAATELNKWLVSIKARKQLVVLDACQSGAAADALSIRGMAEEKAMAQLARSAGLVVLAASSPDQYADEIKELGHGAFTYALLEGLKGKADGGVKDFKITVFELKAWLDDRVPELTSKYRGHPQYPSAFSKGQDFPLIIIH